MSPSLRALLTGILDYAGLFPPAQLPFDQSIRHYLRYRREEEAWMLGRFICPAARLKELPPFLKELAPSEPPLAISVLGRGGASAGEFLAGLTTDMEEIAGFLERHGTRTLVDGFETRLPRDVDQDFLASVLRILEPHAVGTPFFEAAPALIATLGASKNVGFKLRCGGLEASAFPRPEQIAGVIVQCRDAGVPLKFTAGLHHPLRHYDVGVQTHMHGFFNVFGAGVLAAAKSLTENQVRDILQDESAGHFRFDAAGFHWKDLHTTVEQIARARQHVVTSFGSCSFDEPLEDLRALGLLP